MSDETDISPGGDLTDDLIATDVWTDEAVAAAGIPVVDAPFVTIGGGLGSFALVDTLRIAGVAPDQIAVLTTLTEPWTTYEYLARNSQIPGHERLRSDSASTMDNIWGFPSYAVREGLAAKGFGAKLQPLWNVLVEPVLSDFYTPRAGDVYRSVEKEAARIGWDTLLRPGIVRMVRRRHGGGYFSVLTPPEGTSVTRRVAYRSRWAHVAVGYPGVKFLPDLQEYRERHRDFSRVVNAYEPHDHVYEELRARGGTVVVRGSGIVGSRILQRLIDDREQHGADTTIYHLFRNYVHGPQGDSATFRRDGGRGFAYQAFNFPKAAWGGQIKDQFEALDGPERAKLLGRLGGTNTPRRRSWQEQMDRGLAQGFYRQTVGSVTSVVPGPNQTIVTTLDGEDGQTYSVEANFVIDATGLESDIAEHRLLADLLDHGGAARSDYGRLDVDPDFEIKGTRAEPGRMYASGSATLGGHYAGVDSFLGLQYAALRIADDLADQGFGNRIGVGRSISQWWRWVRNRKVDG
ncbi:MAG: hypothetical protein RIE08_01635 [Acidimicrobiales bacterium]